MQESIYEINFDGIVGPTHHYGGYSYGNLASMHHQKNVSSPKRAALEGLKKMKLLADLGIPQAVLPPQERPSLPHLRALGFRGSNETIIKTAAKEALLLLSQLSSASSMWAANAATISPASDSSDGKVHISIANLLNRFHRSIESEETLRLFQRLFPDPQTFSIHSPLPKGGQFGDEGAANHIRFCQNELEKGVQLFVYGKSAFEENKNHFPTRQALEASQAIARRHKLSKEHTYFVEQNPELIDLGVFHNDVISTGHRNFFLFHERAFVETDKLIKQIEKNSPFPIRFLKITEKMLPVKQAVETYFFNSQIVTLPDQTELFIAPEECRSLPLVEWIPMKILFTPLRESMHNGGGPACLRLRMVLTEEERKKVHPSIFLNDSLYNSLVTWVERHYRDKLHVDDLSDPSLLQESQEALDALTGLLKLGSFYSFQVESTCK